MTTFARPFTPDTDGDEEARFPFSMDRAAMRSFLHHVAADPDTTVVSAGGFLGIQLGRANSDANRELDTIAQYDDQGGVELIFPHNPLVQSYARQVWNIMIEWVDGPACDSTLASTSSRTAATAQRQPNDLRRVEQVWDDPRGKPAGTKPGWPVVQWQFDGQEIKPGMAYPLFGRLTLQAWRVANPL